MRTTALVLALSASALVVGAVAPERVAVAGSCGVEPVPPVPPVGTTKCVPICVCDERGQNCAWQFQCR